MPDGPHARVRTVYPGFERNPVTRYQAWCRACRWDGRRYVRFQTALNEAERHDGAEHC